MQTEEDVLIIYGGRRIDLMMVTREINLYVNEAKQIAGNDYPEKKTQEKLGHMVHAFDLSLFDSQECGAPF